MVFFNQTKPKLWNDFQSKSFTFFSDLIFLNTVKLGNKELGC